MIECSNPQGVRWRIWIALMGIALLTGCMSLRPVPRLPERESTVRGQLVIHSNFRFPQKHRLLDELERRRDLLAMDLDLPPSDEPIHIYLFEDQQDLHKYLRNGYPEFTDRRALFVKTDTELKVFAYWGDRVGEDLRHEVTHGYLHSVIQDLPLWLDEGIAEYYEIPQAQQGTHLTHLFQLTDEFLHEQWVPNLNRLELLTHPEDFRQIDYAESWLWIHFLLHDSDDSRAILRDTLRNWRTTGAAPAMAERLQTAYPDVSLRILEHLKELAKQL